MLKELPEQIHASRLRRMKALIIKEFYQIIRDPSSILVCVVIPIMQLFINGYGVSLDMNNLKIGLVIEDSTPDVQSFAQSLVNSPYFNVTLASDRRYFDKSIVKGTVRGIVVVPSYFSAFRQKPDNIAPIQVIADGSEPNTASFVQNYVQEAWQNWLQQQKVSKNLQGLPLVKLQPRFWYNEQLESRNFIIPGALGVIMTIVGTLLTALVVAREWERGTMESMMSTPVSILELLVGKLIPYYILGLCCMAMTVVISLILFHLPMRGSWLALGVISGTYLFVALGLGLLISTLTRDQFAAVQASSVLGFLPAFILGGYLFEISSMPFPIQIISNIFPARYFITCLETLFLVGDIWRLFLVNLIPLFGIGLILYMITASISTKRLD